MGDRTYVTLTVLRAHAEQAKEIIRHYSKEEEDSSNSGYEQGTEAYVFTFSEVNWGSLHFLNEFAEEGIPFTSSWEAGSTYESGERTLRFTEYSEMEDKEISYGDIGIPTEGLMSVILADKNVDTKYDELCAEISSHHARVTPLPWDNQEKYSNLYRARKLIGALPE
jgi:hypothetical protein